MKQRIFKAELKKAERLSSHKKIKELFSEGSSFFIFPFKIIYLAQSHSPANSCPVCILITVSKRHHKKAVSRNLIKRRIREGYRLNKNIICEKKPDAISLYVGIIYVAKDIRPFSEVESKLKQCLLRLSQVCAE